MPAGSDALPTGSDALPDSDAVPAVPDALPVASDAVSAARDFVFADRDLSDAASHPDAMRCASHELPAGGDMHSADAVLRRRSSTGSGT